MMRTLATAVLIGVATGCATGGAARLPKMAVDFDFAAKHRCHGVSPQIRLADVPPGTTGFAVQMTDLDVPSFRHWSQRLPASGAAIPEGAARDYYGPCPPGSETHRYHIEVTALDAQGKALARGEKTVLSGR
jgi:phosphatidylethanolamine-binding protein (PEBP) family uncharacterized protein